MNKSILITLLLSITISADILMIDRGIYKVWYDSALEQPIKVSYFVTNRPKNVDRDGMSFYKDSKFHTSDDKDYYKNVWDKGHMAPAVHFSDSKENLKNTFSYLNSALQHEELNRGEWRLLEAAVRKWSEKETLFVENELHQGRSPTGIERPWLHLDSEKLNVTRNKCYPDGSLKCFAYKKKIFLDLILF